MEEKKLIIYGIGRFAQYVRYVFDHDSNYKVTGYCIERALFKNREFDGLPLYTFEDLPTYHLYNPVDLFIAVGQNPVRKRIFEEAINRGFFMPSYISSKSDTWSNLVLGQNCFIGEGTGIQPFVKIGNNSIHFGSRIGHHSIIYDHTLLSASTLGGSTVIGEGSYLGLNSSVQQNIKVGPKNIIGMNVSIEEDTAEDSVYTHKGTQKRKLTYDQVTQRFLL